MIMQKGSAICRRKGRRKAGPQTRVCITLLNQNGFALITALIISIAVFSLIFAMLYFVTQSTIMSGAGKRYATASEAADGAVEMVKDGVMHSDSLAPNFPVNCNEGMSFTRAVGIMSQNCTLNITSLQGTLGTTYNATATVSMTGTRHLPGYRIEFPPKAYAGGTIGVERAYKIDVKVTGPNNTGCENSVLFRHVK